MSAPTPARWLLREGRRIPRLEEMLPELLAVADQGGLAVQRFVLNVRTLHPVFVARSYICWRHQPVEMHLRRTDKPELMAMFRAGPFAQVQTDGRPIRRRLWEADCPRDYPILDELASAGITDFLVLALPFSDGQLGASVSMATDQPGGWSSAQVTRLLAMVDALALLCELRSTRDLAETVADLYIGRLAGPRVLDGSVHRGHGQQIDAIIWCADLRDFTRRSEEQPPEQVIALLNRYFECMTQAVQSRGGEVLKFIGDGFLAIFPIPSPAELRISCERAVDAVWEAQRGMAALDREDRAEGGPGVHFGICLHRGEVVYGNIGAPDRLDFTVIGRAVNQASRIEGLCRSLGESTLLSPEFAACVPELVRPVGPQQLRGVRDPVLLYALRAPVTELSDES